MEQGNAQTPLEDLRKDALDHYEHIDSTNPPVEVLEQNRISALNHYEEMAEKAQEPMDNRMIDIINNYFWNEQRDWIENQRKAVEKDEESASWSSMTPLTAFLLGVQIGFLLYAIVNSL